MKQVDKLLSYMRLFEGNRDIQLRQTEHRMRLIEAFDIKPGDNVLEVGCGQGDTTVVLADAVGESGFVDAVDIASSDYGAPLTLKEATDHISQSIVGNRVNFQFETNVLDEEFTGQYDVAVLSHSLFYFSNPDDILKLFSKLRRLSSRICVAEWDIDFTSSTQSAHAQAILLQVLFAKYNDTSQNIQILITKAIIADLLKQAGWRISEELIVDARDLDDSRWEVAVANELEFEIFKSVFTAYKEVMNKTVQLNQIDSLNSFVIKAN